jgi:hypothetical protein
MPRPCSFRRAVSAGRLLGPSPARNRTRYAKLLDQAQLPTGESEDSRVAPLTARHTCVVRLLRHMLTRDSCRSRFGAVCRDAAQWRPGLKRSQAPVLSVSRPQTQLSVWWHSVGRAWKKSRMSSSPALNGRPRSLTTGNGRSALYGAARPENCGGMPRWIPNGMPATCMVPTWPKDARCALTREACRPVLGAPTAPVRQHTASRGLYQLQ